MHLELVLSPVLLFHIAHALVVVNACVALPALLSIHHLHTPLVLIAALCLGSLRNTGPKNTLPHFMINLWSFLALHWGLNGVELAMTLASLLNHWLIVLRTSSSENLVFK